MNWLRHLVIGGTRCGKTRHALSLAQSLARQHDVSVTYVATAEPVDEEMSDRIARHRAERPSHWRTLEAPHRLARSLAGLSDRSVVIVDCLTLWLSNALLQDFRDDNPTASLPTWSTEFQEFLEYLQAAPHHVVLVSNEVGWSIVPEVAVARRFRDEQGRLNQGMASLCNRVTMMVAGLPIELKQDV